MNKLILCFLLSPLFCLAQSIPPPPSVFKMYRSMGPGGVAGWTPEQRDTVNMWLMDLWEAVNGKQDAQTGAIPFTNTHLGTIAALESRQNLDSNKLYTKYGKLSTDALDKKVPFDSSFIGQLAMQNYRVKALQMMKSRVVAESFIGWSASNNNTAFTLTDGRANNAVVPVFTTDTARYIGFTLRNAASFTADNWNGFIVTRTDFDGSNFQVVGQTANDPTIWSTGYSSTRPLKKVPLLQDIIVTPGIYTIGAVFNASATTTAPQVHDGSASNGDDQEAFDFPTGFRLGFWYSVGATPPTSVAFSSTSNLDHRYSFALFK